MKKLIILGLLLAAPAFAITAKEAKKIDAQIQREQWGYTNVEEEEEDEPTMAVRCPDGTYVAKGPCKLCPNGKYVSGKKCKLMPDGTYVGR
jgi:hypothetical protein